MSERKGLSSIVRAKVRAGELCYICEERTPLPQKDEFGGHSCQQCQQDLAAGRRHSLIREGYQPRGRGDVR